MRCLINRFLKSESGAVTVDWVVLCAGLVAIAVVITAAMQDNAVGLADSVSGYLTSWTF